MEKITYQPTDVLLGDGQARVERTRYEKHGLGYGDFAISSSCTVSLSCNQDDATIREALRVVGMITKAVLREDDKDMTAILTAVAGQLSVDHA